MFQNSINTSIENGPKSSTRNYLSELERKRIFKAMKELDQKEMKLADYSSQKHIVKFEA